MLSKWKVLITEKIDSIFPTESADFERFVPVKVVHPDKNWKFSFLLDTPLDQFNHNLVEDSSRDTALRSYEEVHLWHVRSTVKVFEVLLARSSQQSLPFVDDDDLGDLP